MKTIIRLFTLLVLLVTGYATASESASPQSILNTLPIHLGEILVQNHLISPDEDDLTRDSQGNPKGHEIMRFIKALQGSSSFDPVEEFFRCQSGMDCFKENPELKPVKLSILRYFKEASDKELADSHIEKKLINQISQKILNNYVEMTISLIRLSGVTEYDAIITRFRSLRGSSAIQLSDLTPELRSVVSSDIHGKDLALINGMFIPSKGLLAIDISDCPKDSVYTLAHELVHAADPVVNDYHQQILDQTPMTLAILSQYLGDVPDAEKNVRGLIDQEFHELQFLPNDSLAAEMRDQRIAILQKQLKSEELSKLTENPTLQAWARAYVGYTIENEFRAYVFSTMVYKNLSEKQHITSKTPYRETFLGMISNSLKGFAEALELKQNPTNNPTIQNALTGLISQSGIEPVLRRRLVRISEILEFHYLNAVKNFVQSIPEKYKLDATPVATDLSLEKRYQDTVVPEWAKPGNFDKTLNPYTILTAKISTLWILRFKESVKQTSGLLKDKNETLMGLKAGILDLHDVKLGQLKGLGLQRESATSQVVPDDVPASLRQDLDAEPELIRKYFVGMEWNPNAPALTPGTNTAKYLDQIEVMRRVLILNNLTILDWLVSGFPSAYENFKSIRVLQERLHEMPGDEEMSRDRIKELEEELVQTQGIAQLSTEDLERMKILVESLTNVYNLALEKQWNDIARDLYQNFEVAIRLLRDIGLESSVSPKVIAKNIDDSTKAFTKQVVEGRFKECRNYGPEYNIVFLTGTGSETFTLGTSSFQVTALCYDRRLYVLRQPGGHNKDGTTWMVDGPPDAKGRPQKQPEFHVFSGGRPIHLTPFHDYNNDGFHLF